MIVGFQVLRDRPAGRRHLGATASCSKTRCTASARWSCRRPQTQPTTPRASSRAEGTGGTARWPTRDGLGRHPGLQRSGRRSARSSRRSPPPAPWHEIIVVDDGSTRRHGAHARRRPARRVVRHPYNKGNGAAVKSGIRRATGEFVLIIDGDGQHQPEDARRLVGPARRVRPGHRRARGRDAGDAGAPRSATRR